jgi:aspartate aminotransferase
MFAKRIITLLPSPTMALDVRAKALERRGVNIINLTAGEPDYETPEVIKQAAIQAIQEGFTHYTDPQGIVELREAIAKKFKRDNNISYEPSQIIVGAGSKQVLYAAFQTLCDKGDEVILPTPVWTSFVEQIKLAEGKPVLLKLKPPFEITADVIEKAITQKTKIILLNSPSNPTGRIIDKSELKKIAKLVIKHDLWVITDEIYEKISYTQRHTSFASLSRAIREKTITVNGVSKAFAMTGWRIGYAGGPQNVIRAMTSLQSQIISNANSIAQIAAIRSLKSNADITAPMYHSFTKRREYLLSAFAEIPHVSVIEPEGAFYLFICIEQLLGQKYKTAVEWCDALLKEEHVAVVPGEAFLYPGYFRLSFTSPTAVLQEAISKIKRFIEKNK